MPDSPRPTGPLQRLLFLKRVPLLAGLTGVELAIVAEPAIERFVPRGEVLLHEGEPVGAVHVVMEGALGAWRRGRHVARIGPGQAVGGYALFAGDPSGTRLVAEEDTLALELDADAVMEVLEDRFPILHHLLRELSRQLISLITHHRLDPVLGMGDAEPPRGRERGQLDLVDRIIFLRQRDPFRRTSVNALAELARALTQVRFEAGTVLWREGEAAPSVFLLLDGRVRATSEARGLSFQPGPGFPLGSLEAIGETPRFYDAIAETPVAALHGSAEVLVDVFEDSFEMAMEYLGVLSRAALRIMDSNAAQGRGALEGLPGA